MSRTHADARTALGLALAVTGVGLLMARLTYDNFDGLIMGQVAQNLADHHSATVAFDPLKIDSPYSSFGLGMSLLMIPTYFIGTLVGAGAIAGIMATNAWLLGAFAALVFAWARLRACTRPRAVALALLMAIGGGLLPYTSTGFSEVALADAVTAALVALTALHQQRPWAPVALGAATGATVLVRSDSALLIAPFLVLGAVAIAAPLITGRAQRLRAAGLLIAGALPFAIVWAWYNAARYGRPWRLGYDSVLVLQHPIARGVYGLLFSPGKGLVVFAPLLLVALLGLAAAWQHDRVSVSVAVAIVVARIAFFAAYWGWYGGGSYGPRFLVPLYPLALLGLIPLARGDVRPQRALTGVAVALSAWGVVGGISGAVVDYTKNGQLHALAEVVIPADQRTGRAFVRFEEADATMTAIDHRLLVWSHVPATEEVVSLLHGRDVSAAALTSATPARSRTHRLAGSLLLMVGGAWLATGGLVPRRSQRGV